MRLKEIAPQTETITFHVASNSKKFLKEYAKRQNRPFSELVRDAVNEYIRTLQEDEALSHWASEAEEGSFASSLYTLSRNVSDLENPGIDFKEWISKKRKHGWSYSDMFKQIDEFVNAFRKDAPLHHFPYDTSSEVLESISLEIAKQHLALKLRWGKQVFLHLHYLTEWRKQEEEKKKRDAVTAKFVSPINKLNPKKKGK